MFGTGRWTPEEEACLVEAVKKTLGVPGRYSGRQRTSLWSPRRCWTNTTLYYHHHQTASTPTTSLPSAGIPWAAVAARMAPAGCPRSRIHCLTKWAPYLDRLRRQVAKANAGGGGGGGGGGAAAASSAGGGGGGGSGGTETERGGKGGGGGGGGAAAGLVSPGVQRVRALVASDLLCVRACVDGRCSVLHAAACCPWAAI